MRKLKSIMAKLKLNQIKKIICPTCKGNGFITNTDMEDGEKYIHQCWDCDSEGEYYVTKNDNLIGDTNCDDDIIEFMRSLPVRRV